MKVDDEGLNAARRMIIEPCIHTEQMIHAGRVRRASAVTRPAPFIR
jgi:hypothetical protein